MKKKMEQHIQPIAVIGGTGKSGKYLVQTLITLQIPFHILVRNPEHFSIQNPAIKVVEGEVKDYDKIVELLQGCQAVISTLGMGLPPSEPTIFSQSTSHVLKAMQALEIKRYIVITGLNVDTPFDQKGPKTAFATNWMRENFPKSTADKQQEYELLSASELDWTMVRLPIIEQTDHRTEIKVNLEDCPGDKISATDLAHFLIGQLSDREYIRKAPFIANG